MAYLGEWSTLVGSGAINDTVTHDRSLYTLLVNIANITLSEPSTTNTNYRCDVGATPMTLEATEDVEGLKTFKRSRAIICKGLAVGTLNSTYIDFVDNNDVVQGRVGQASSGTDETYLYNGVDGAGIRLSTTNGYINMLGIPKSSAAIDVSDSDYLLNISAMDIRYLKNMVNATFLSTLYSSTGGIGENTRARLYSTYTGGGSGYGGSLIIETRNSSNAWVSSMTISDTGSIVAPSASTVTATSIANVGTLDLRYRTLIDVTFTGNGNNIKLKGTSAGVAASPYLRFYDSADDALGYFGVGSTGNNDIIMACEKVDGKFKVVTGGSTNFIISAAGYATLGSGSPAIKMKKVTGTTGSTDGASVNIAHGLTASKILAIDVLVTDASNNRYSPQCTEANKEYRSWVDNTNVVVKVGGTDVRSRPIAVLITYEE